MIGHAEEARGYYRNYQKRDFDPSLIKQARFRKALERACEFARRTQVLMEEPRFLLRSITAGTLRLALHSLGAVAREVLECLRPAATRRGLEIVLANRVPPHLDRVQMDRDLIYIAVFNLVDNAVKYSHRDQHVGVEISMDQACWVLNVRNKGVYVGEEDREAIFEPFTRRPTGPAARMRPGTGLGLPTAREIVQAHGGTIRFESRLRRDTPDELAETVFTVKTPRHVHEAT